MPQLSIETYVTQYIWLVIILGNFYYYLSSQKVPKIVEIKKTRPQISAASISSPSFSSSSQPIQFSLLTPSNFSNDHKTADILLLMNKKWVSH
jgi:hypothetical protein